MGQKCTFNKCKICPIVNRALNSHFLGFSMIVCLCYGISDSQIKKIIKDGATNVETIQKKCPAGQSCGSCVQFLNELINENNAPLIFPQAEPQGSS